MKRAQGGLMESYKKYKFNLKVLTLLKTWCQQSSEQDVRRKRSEPFRCLNNAFSTLSECAARLSSTIYSKTRNRITWMTFKQLHLQRIITQIVKTQLLRTCTHSLFKLQGPWWLISKRAGEDRDQQYCWEHEHWAFLSIEQKQLAFKFLLIFCA